MCSVLTLTIGNNQGMGDVEYGKIYDIYFPPSYLRLFDGPSCSIIDMWRIFGRDMANGGLVVGREEFGGPCLLDASPHGLDNLRDAFVHLTENLVALGLVILDKVAALPECVAGLSEWLRLQAELWLDDGAND